MLIDCVETPLWGPFGQDECYGDGWTPASPAAIVFQPALAVAELLRHELLPQAVTSVINVLVDWNRDGDWNDVFMCPRRALRAPSGR